LCIKNSKRNHTEVVSAQMFMKFHFGDIAHVNHVLHSDAEISR